MTKGVLLDPDELTAERHAHLADTTPSTPTTRTPKTPAKLAKNRLEKEDPPGYPASLIGQDPSKTDDTNERAHQEGLDTLIQQLLDELTKTRHELAQTRAEMAHLKVAHGDFDWGTLIEPPRAYDVPNPARQPAGIRVVPELKKAIDQVQTRRGLRSNVGAWEYLLRLGLAVEQKIPLK